MTARAAPVTAPELAKHLAYYKSIERLDVDFKQVKVLSDLDLKLRSEGHLSLKFPDHVEYRISKPEPLRVELDKQKISIFSPDGMQTFSQSENPSAKDQKNFATMLSWLRLDAASISEKYTIIETSAHHFHFVAKEPQEMMMKALDMEVAPDGHVIHLTFFEVSGDQLRLDFGVPKVTRRTGI